MTQFKEQAERSDLYRPEFCVPACGSRELAWSRRTPAISVLHSLVMLGGSDPLVMLEVASMHEVANCDSEHSRSSFLRCLNTTKGTIVCEKVVWATGAARKRGLLGRPSLAADEGMFIVPTQWIHMFGMRFPIDVAFISSQGRVLAVHHGLKPNRLSRLVLRAEGALELAAGTLALSRTTVGDRIELVDIAVAGDTEV